MSHVIAELGPSRPKLSKADITDQVARAIIGAEAERRAAKTARLRQARLENEAKLAAKSPPAKPRRSKRRVSPSS